MWDSIYGYKSKALMFDIALEMISNKVEKVSKNTSRKYYILENDVTVIKMFITDTINKVFNNEVIDNDHNLLCSNDIKKITNDLLYILYTANGSRKYKESFLKRYIECINKSSMYVMPLVSSLISISQSIIEPTIKDLFTCEDIFIEDAIINKDNDNEIVLIAIRFL